MKALLLFAVVFAAFPSCRQSSSVAGEERLRPDWSAAFTAEGATGTFVLHHPGIGLAERLNPLRAAERFCPASTFKVYNSLVALEEGAVSDVDSLHAWDGRERAYPAWNRDHSLRTGMRYSTVWLYQRLARALGREAYRAAFAKTPYGNVVVGEDLSMFWLDGSLRISADEEVAFLAALLRGETGFAKAHQRSVYAMMPVVDSGVVDGRPYRLLGKTGMGLPSGEPQIGWMVGYLEHGRDTLVYAMNSAEAEGRTYDMVGGRLRIVRMVLGLD